MADVVLQLLGACQLRVAGATVQLPPASRRLVAFLGLHLHPVPRARVAGTLWDSDHGHAAGCLRSALWRANTLAGRPIVAADRDAVRLDQDVTVDYRALLAIAHEVLTWSGDDRSRERPAWQPTPSDLTRELLPGWEDDWAVTERERIRLVGLETLEALSQSLLRRGQVHQAIEAALWLVAADPWREAAYLLLVQGYLEAGNRPEAWRQFQRCRRVLREELQLEPGTALSVTIGRAFPGWRAAPRSA